MDRLVDIAKSFLLTPFDLDVRFSLIYLNATLLIAFLVWLFRDRDRPFLEWLLPASVYRHRSNLLDIKLFLLNRAISVFGVFGAVMFAPLIAYQVLLLLTGGGASLHGDPTTAQIVWATVVIFVTIDFCKYWSHRIHHEWAALWPFHAVHHSAEVLTPLTLARSHPVETIVRNIIISLLVGAVQGVALAFFTGRVDVMTIGGANVLYFAFNILGSNLRHSHIWLSYGRVLEHVFISPAQHQVHHSIAVEHHNKNYGSVFALWDWMFGTLYVPPHRQTLDFGVSDAAGRRLEMPHPTLRDALVGPFRASWRVLKKRRSRPPAHIAHER